jgi:glutathione S-transferase
MIQHPFLFLSGLVTIIEEMSKGVPKLTWVYFDEVGRGFPIQVCLQLKNIPLEKEIVSMEEWPIVQKDRSRFPCGDVPVLKIDGTLLTESIAQMTYIGQLTGCWPTDPLDGARALSLLLAYEQIFTGQLEYEGDSNFLKSYMVEDKEQKIALLSGPVTSRIKYYLCEYCDKYIGTDGYCVGQSTTILDYHFYYFVKAIQVGVFEGLDPQLCQLMPNLMKVVDRIEQHTIAMAVVGPLFNGH